MEFKTIIGKDVLLEKLGENRKRYVKTRKTLIEVYKEKNAEYTKAYAEYSKKVYDGTVTEAEAQPHPPMIPEDRTGVYDLYVEMVELHCDKTLEIDNETFKSLFMDKWDFIRSHISAMTVWAEGHPTLSPALAAYNR